MSSEKPMLRILIAEDDPNLGEALVSFLRERGHTVDLARHGAEALKLLAQRSYPLILADLVMPEVDGLEVLRAARQRNPASLVVIMTGHASLACALQATREGAYDYLRKPFNLREIEVAVDNAARLLSLKEENGRLAGLKGRQSRRQALPRVRQPTPQLAQRLPGGPGAYRTGR